MTSRRCRWGSLSKLRTVALAATAFAMLLGAAPAFAECSSQTQCRPWWHLDSSSAPTNLPPGDREAKVVITASNLGDAPADGSKHAITIADTLPPGLRAVSMSGELGTPGKKGKPGEMVCPDPAELKEKEEKKETELTCSYGETVEPYELLEVAITVEVQSGLTGGGIDEASVAGGEGPNGEEPQAQQLRRSLSVSAAPTPFGIERVSLTPENEDGSTDTQAGSHPFQLTTALDLNQAMELNAKRKVGLRSSPALAKDLQFNLPPGLIGNPQAVDECSEVDFTAIENAANACAPDTAVGVAMVTINEPFNLGVLTTAVPVFNLVPAPGEPARFGFFALHVSVVLDTSLRTGGDYGVVVSVKNASQTAEVLSSQVTLWGVPGDPSHDLSRGWACVEQGQDGSSSESCTAPEQRAAAPFLTLPTSCGAPLVTSVLADSWLEPGQHLPDGAIDTTDPRWKEARSVSPPLEGCERLPFNPSIEVEPDEHSASTPTGLNVDVRVPQANTLSASSLAEADVRDTTVTLPEGLELSPGAADGLLACSAAAIGLVEGSAESQQTENDHFSADPPDCPEEAGVHNAKLGTVRIKTPLLANELEGGVYLAQQGTDPFQAPLVLYVIARDPVSGVLVKLAGKITPDPVSGRLVSSFENTPPLPFEELQLHFFNGPRASISTPSLCGDYGATSSFTPWSATAPATPASSFQISSGPGASGCPPNPRPLAPAFQAGSSNLQAGAFTPFIVSIVHADQDQPLSAITIRLPTGLAAILASVRPCPEPQAGEGACGPESLIGHTSTSSGLGTNPFTLAGQVFLSGPYAGAPFGLSIVTPAIAGPFDLGRVVVRSAINVDPYTAAVTISGAVPTMVETAAAGKTGIPVQLKALSVTIDRPGFDFNPTSCNPKTIEGLLGGAQGASAHVFSRFQVEGCANLPFKPVFRASTQGKTSKADGASLKITVTSPGLGQANIAKTTVTLPTTLPARLSTLQKACVAAVFEANPASCPEGSDIGSATIHTPVFSNALSGPAYLVSHGNVAFPDVEFVLQGEGLEIILDGKTQIKHGVTTSSFEALPDAPFSSFETTLPEGPHSALTANLPAKANYSLCNSSLSMPTTITAQNGKVIKQKTKIVVQGCGKVQAVKPRLTRAQLLAKALMTCRKKDRHAKDRRARCENLARRAYHATQRRRGTRTARENSRKPA
jgi:hypothetical protein